MRIQPLADVHIEMTPCDIPIVGEVVVLAGDIGVGDEGVRWAKRQFDGTPTLYVAGNHTYYGQLFPDTLGALRTAAAGSSVHVLENEALVLDGVRFLGATLWTDFCLEGEAHQTLAMLAAKRGMNDFRRIRKASGELLQPRDMVRVHTESVAWLRGQLAEPFDGQTVVVTHHAPCVMSSAPEYRLSDLAPAFSSNLEALILEFSPALWISGHTHYSCDYHIGATRMVSNQRGYSDLEATGFDPALTIEV